MTRSPFVAHVVLMSLAANYALALAAPPRRMAIPRAARLEQGPPLPAAGVEDCNEALRQRRAPLATLSRTYLWPPNHALVDVGLLVDLTPPCAGLADLRAEVWGDEADDAPTGDGTTTGDARFVEAGLYLRAERIGSSDGRVYLIVARASTPDAAGYACRTVVIPQSGSQAAVNAVNAQAAAARATCEASGGPPPAFFPLAEATLSAANHAPVVDAGPDQGADFPSTVALHGSASDDGLPSGHLVLGWSKVSGPEDVVFADPAAASTTVTFSAAGSYVLKLTADDGALSVADEVTVVLASANQAPVVDAGADQSVVLPAHEVALHGTASDDGHPGPGLAVAWSVVSAPAGATVVFAAPSAVDTIATLSHDGSYLLRLTANDGQFAASDDVAVTVHPEPPPVLSVADASLAEGNEGRGGGQLQATLSHAWSRPVTVDFMTMGGTATAECDYATRYGTLTVPTGETTASILLPVVGELAPETAETVRLQLGNVTEATLDRDAAVLTILDDDAVDQPPTAHSARRPGNGETGTPMPAPLAWSSVDPDPGDTVAHDVYLGTAMSLDGQAWTKVCTSGPGPRPSTAFALDEADDVLIVVEDGPDGVTTDRSLLLADATGAGGPPRWVARDVAGGPRLVSARAALLPSGGLAVVGRCADGCGDRLDAWILDAAAQPSPAWRHLAIPSPPAARTGFASAGVPGTDRMVVFGGLDAGGGRLDDLWVLDGAAGATPAWRRVDVGGDRPSPREGAALAYDDARGRLLLFGGRTDATTASDELWSLEGLAGAQPAWHRIEVTGAAPAPRFGHAAAFDPGAGRLLVFGGTTAAVESGLNYVFGDAWLFDGEAWSRVVVPAPYPVGRYGAIVAYSASANRLIAAAGRNNKLPAAPADLWVLGDAMGLLPVVSVGQAAQTFTADGLDAGATYLWRVVTRDAHGAWRGAPIWRFTGNHPPVVDAGSDAVVEMPPGTLALSGSATDDGRPAGSSVSAQWTMVSGSAAVAFDDASAPGATATFATEGQYVLRLTATDGALAAQDDLTVVVEPPNAPPTVDAGPDRALELPQSTTQLQGTVADDGRPAGGALSIAWSQVSGPGAASFATPSQAVTLVTVGLAGTFVLRLSATDGRATVSDDVTVTLSPANAPPHVDAGPDQALVLPAGTTTLTGTVVDDGRPSGVLTHAWAQLAGPAPAIIVSPASAVTEATFTQVGTYRLRLSVSDGVLSADDEVRVIVGSSAVLPDLVVAGVDAGALVVDPSTLQMSGSVSATISNVGPGSATTASTVTFFEDRNRTGAFEPAADVALGSAPVGPLGPGESATVVADVSAATAFAGNLVYAYADSTAAVVEGDEGNNYGSSAPACAYRPPDHAANPAVEYVWRGSPQQSLSNKPCCSTLVVDLDLDGRPEILFPTNKGNGFIDYSIEGSLRAVNGADHAEVFTTAGADRWLTSMVQLAAGNLDGDPYPEIVAGAQDEAHLLAFEHDGSLKWRSAAVERLYWGAPALADLDGDGVAEIVVGRQVLNADGSVRWTGAGSSGNNFGNRGGNATVVDLDLDGRPEVVAGNTAYRGSGPQQGQILWWRQIASGVPVEDGYTAAANFDADPYPEMVLVAHGVVWMLEHDGSVKWGPVAIPGGATWGGSPAIGNLDADPDLEFVVAGRERVAVFEKDGTVAWTAPSSQSTNSAAPALFDFDGDGIAEIVYQDERSLRIFGGGQVLFEVATWSAVGRGSVVVADVDGDGKPEILSTDNSFFTVAPGTAGLRVWGDAADTWVRARPLWNQFEYHVSNVNDDASIPAIEARGLAHSRQQVVARVANGTVTPGCAYAKPDLTASLLRVDRDATATRLTVRIGNGGAAVAGPRVPVSFYDGDPADGGQRLGTVRTVEVLAPGAWEDVVLALAADAATSRSVHVAADDHGGLVGTTTESDEGNNVYDSGVALHGGAAGPDLVVASVDVSSLVTDPMTLVIGGAVGAVVRNQGDQATSAFAVAFFDDANGNGAYDPGVDSLLGTASVSGGLAPRAEVSLTVPLSGTVRFAGSPVHAFADSAHAVAETDEANNVTGSAAACRAVPPPGVYTPRLERRWTSSAVDPASANVAAAPLVADLDGDGFADIVFVTYAGTAATGGGRLRALSGRDGSEMFTVTNPAYALSGWANLALADLDLDGRPEIVAVHEQDRLIAFEHDGAFKWMSPALEFIEWGGPAIADLDGDGSPEILMGRQVLSAGGALLRTAPGANRGGNGGGTFATVADLDLDGTPEVLVGDAAYSNAGALLWDAGLPDGHTAAANFDADPFPEIVLVAQGRVWLLEHDGTVAWGPVTLPGLGFGGAPTVADVDGDGQPEIVVALKNALSVVETAGIIRWTVATVQPATNWSVGVVASAFDLDGDGAAEILFSDEAGLKVLRGRDGALLAQQPVPSCNPSRALPVVADVDGDGNAEIVAAANRACNAAFTPGIAVIGDARDGWVTARPLWNQYDYTVANVGEGATVPRRAPAGRVVRANDFGAGSRFRAPDLGASHVLRAEDGADLVFTIRVGNGGDGAASAGVPVSLYNGDPRLGFARVATTVTTRVLRAGEFEDVVVRVPSATAAENALFVGVDQLDGDAGVARECEEPGNLAATPYFLNREPVANAGSDSTIVQPQEIATLSGSASDDGLPLGSTLVVGWDYLGGPTEIPPVIADPTSVTTTVRLLVPGQYVFRLIAFDSLRSFQDLVVVTLLAANQPPQVDAGADRVLSHPTTSTVLAGVVSDDGLPAGSTVTYQWTVSGVAPGAVTFSAPHAASTSASFAATGTYRLRLSASDGALSAYDEVEVIVDPANSAPAVSAGNDLVLAGRSGQLAGTVTDDGLPRGATLALTWSLVEGAGEATWADPHATATAVEFSADGTYLLRLTATDGSLFAWDDVVVRVNPVNLPPVVDAGPDQSLATERMTLAATASDDGLPAGAGLALAWSVVSGPGHVAFDDLALPGTAASFSADGDYVLRFTASDSLLQSSDTVAVHVAAGNHAPFVSAGPDRTLPVGAFAIALAGEVVDDGIPGGAVLATWSQVSGPGAATFVPATSAGTTVSFDAPGVYALRLTGWDGLLASSDEVQVAVAAEAPTGPPPTATLTSPQQGTQVTSPAEITGTVASDSLLGWALERRRRSDESWVRFAGGSSPGAVSGVLDPTLLANGLYEVRLRATDRAGRSAAASIHVVITGNAKVGAFTVEFVDLEVPVAGLPIQVTRTYDSRDTARGDFGHGWRADVSTVRVEETGVAGLSWIGTTSPGYFPTYCLQTARPQLVTVTMPDGKVLEFEPTVTPQCRTFLPMEEVTVGFRARPGTQGTLEPVGGNAALVVGAWPPPLQSGAMELFSSSSFQVFDPAAYRLTLPDGRALVIDEQAGLRSLADRSGNALTVSAAGIIHSSGKSVAFVRDALGRIERMVDPAGHATLYAYDPAGDLATVTDREGNLTRFAYHGRFAHHLERITDALGRQPIRNEYYDDGRIKSHTDAFGKTILYAHDVSARQEVVTDRNGKQRVLDYDERGNVTRETDPAGKVVLRTFDARNNRLTETVPHDPGAPSPATTTYAYDAADNVTSVTDGAGNRSDYTFNARRQVLTSKDARGRITENTYDPANGNLLTTRDPDGQLTTYTYDAQGSVRTQTVVVDGEALVTAYDYDTHGNLVRETDALGHRTDYTYDANGNRMTQTTARGLFACDASGCTQTSTETLTTTYAYDAAGRLTETRNPGGSITRTTYDAMGRQVETFDALGHRTGYEYDEMGRLVRTTFADATFEESTYDHEGRRLTSRDRDGKVTGYEYDDVGRLVRTTYADGATSENHYDEAGRLVGTTDGRGKTTTFAYDLAGRRTLVRDPVGHQTTFTYDGNGNQLTVRDARGATTTYEYDALNRRTKTIFPDQTFVTTAYDAIGRRRNETDQALRVTRFDYDRVGRLVRVTDAAGKDTRYTYDEVGNRIAQRDANGHVTSFEYDSGGRETARILPDGRRETREYDAGGNVRRRVDFMGRATTYAYDAMTRLSSRSYPDGSAVGFTYTPMGRRSTVTDSRGVTSYGYDLRHRMASLTYPDGRRLEYAYDANGNRSSVTARVDGLVLATGFSYDDAGRLDLVTDPLSRVYDHGYDANGNRASLAYPNGTVTAYAYDGLNRLTSLATTHPGSGVVVQGYGFTLGPSGNRLAITESDGTRRAYTYDSLYRLTGERITIGGPLQYEKTFTYDDVGNRLTQVTAGTGAPGTPLAPASVSYSYDARDRLLTEAMAAGPSVSSSYDENGNLVSRAGDATYTWDFENRLVRVTKADGTVVAHEYDADGNRVSTSVTPAGGGSAVVTSFLVDTSGPLSHVVAETNAAGSLGAYYVRADDLLAVMRPSAPFGWLSRFVHADGIGSIRRLTDEAGLVTDGYTYTAFGELIAHTGPDPQPYAFAGEPYDPNTRLQYHRARWLDPTTGRFFAMDLFEGLDEDPASLHKYLYASGDPGNEVDPSGLESLPTQLTTLSSSVTVALGNFGAQLRPAFERGGPVLGNLFRAMGTYAQGAAQEVLIYYQRFEPTLQIRPDRPVNGRVIDFFLRLGNISYWLEVKYGLPSKLGGAMTRLVAQVNAAVAAGEGQVVVWSLRVPGASQIARVREQIGANASAVEFISGIEGLWTWVTRAFGAP